MNLEHVLARGAKILEEIKTGLKSHFFRNVFVLMSGTALSQVINVAVAPLLTRLYDPKDFGEFGVFMSITGILIAVCTLRYDQALMLPKRTEDAANLFGISVIGVAAVSSVATAICLGFGSQIAAAAKSPALAQWLWLSPIFVLLSGGYQTLNAWSTRRKQFHRASISQVVRSIATSIAQLAAGIGGGSPTGLVGGAVAGSACASAALGIQVLKDDRSFFRGSLRLSEMKRLAKEYSDFPLYSGTQSLLNATSQNLPMLLLAHYFGPAVAGLYSLGVRILQLPMNLVLTSLRQVLFQKASEVYNNGGDTYALFKKTTLGLLAIAIGPAAIVVLFAPPAFAFVLGQEWYAAGEYARWLVLWLALMFSNVPAVLFAQIYRKQRALLIQDIALLVCRAGALLVGGMYCSAIQTIILYSLVGVAFNAYIILWTWRLLLPHAPGAAKATP